MKRGISFLICLILFLAYPISVKAEINTDFKTRLMSSEDISNKKYITEIITYNKPSKSLTNLTNIAVSNNEARIAIGFEHQRIEIYDRQGNFKIGYRLNASGAYGILYDSQDDNLCIYLVRSKLIYKIDYNGHLLDMKWVDNTDFNMNIWKSLIYQDTVVKNDSKYYLGGIGKTSFYYKCILETPSCKSTIYTQKAQVIFMRVLKPILILVLFIFTGVVVILAFRKQGTD